MTRKAIQTKEAPQAIGPYSQAIDLGDLVLVSGQIPLNPKTMEVVEGDIETQTNQVMHNLDAILREAGLTFEHVAKFTIYITNMDDFAKINEAYAKFLTEPFPARATVEVSSLPKGVAVEMDVIAKR
ncbi:2-iminobutanoate/2-iminopropanoate deaminase [Paraliobacillus ryukyuensis]|uniref:2-iminobutanoate/2-iminopropanoate deaminase n=1 Tax=Paraliobacillus ryukyuensis TaxID=200904 RepID=A0A366EFB1_9BACI|nr:RidA family protein [Paraliobacillus ryukyuensis]RBP00420.1 2-iminobutanoate/2-iminopropanoate deaminase [Paraliobacillus ryukyuensis]